MYAGVPSTAPSTVRPSPDEVVAGRGVAGASGWTTPSLARPQSMTTVSPNAPTSTFCGLRSRWITPWLWA